MGEIIRFRMFHYEYAPVTQQVAFKDQFRHFRQFLQRIRRIGKNKIETLFRSRMQIAEHIATDQMERFGLQFFCDLCNERSVCIILTLLHSLESNSNEILPVPANKSSASVPSRSVRLLITLKRFSFAKSVVGRALKEDGTSKRLRPYIPLIIRIQIKLLNPMGPERLRLPTSKHPTVSLPD